MPANTMLGQVARGLQGWSGILYDYTLDNILSYNNSFGKHEIGATLLYGCNRTKFNGTFAEGTGFAQLNLSYNSLQQANTQKVSSNALGLKLYCIRWPESIIKFNNRYLLTATVRQDGFSGFSKITKPLFSFIFWGHGFSLRRFIRILI